MRIAGRTGIVISREHVQLSPESFTGP